VTKHWGGWLAGVVVAGIVVGLPVGHAHYRQANLRNFKVVRPGVLYRSGQLSLDGLDRLIDAHGIRTVVSLRDSDDGNSPPPDAAEEAFCKAVDVRHVRIAPRSWWPQYDGPPPAEQGVTTFLSVMDDPSNHPVLLHCFAGVHRTGAMVAVYRMQFDGWSNAEALEELRAGGYKNLDRELDVRAYLANYRPRRTVTPGVTGGSQ
jgi:protein tyrosine/serine phosphatase